MNKTSVERPIELDELDGSLIACIRHKPGITLMDVNKKFPETPYYTIWYRINTMAKVGYIQIKRNRKILRCYAAGDLG